MSCISPITIKSPIKSHDKSFIYVPCGKCAWCRRTYRNEWFLRLKEESFNHNYTKFITLTYSEENIPFFLDESTGEFKYLTSKSDIQKFLKRFRKHYKLRYFIVSESSAEIRPHYHGILFLDQNINDSILRKFWKNGVTDCQDASDATMMYTTKYILKGSDRTDNFKLQSTRPGIGYSYIKANKVYQQYYKDPVDGIYKHRVSYNNRQYQMPRYYRKLLRKLIDPLDYEINMIKNLKQMEIQHRFDQYDYFLKEIKDPLIRISKIEEARLFKYNRDLIKQIELNSKEFKLWK